MKMNSSLYLQICVAQNLEKKQVKNLKRYEHCANAVCALCARRQRAASTRPHSTLTDF